MKEVHICSINELQKRLQNDQVDIDRSFVIISSTYPLAPKYREIFMMNHSAYDYADIDFDYSKHSLTPEAADGFAKDIMLRKNITDWYFVSDRGVRRSAAICCAALRYWKMDKEELAVWADPEKEPNAVVFIRMCRALGVPIGNVELHKRLHTNKAAIQNAIG